jgi:allantoicase
MTATFLDLVDLASERLGGSVVAANDEFFAPKEGLINPAAPVWIEGKYTERGKWMDGWETRRRRDGGDHDWCIVRLGVPGVVRGVDVETTFFKGNFPESCAVDACDTNPLAAADELSRVSWREVVPRTTLAGDSHNPIAAAVEARATHVRLRIFPDGGVARLRVHGDVTPDWDRLRTRGDVDLAAVEHGGLVVACSDMFFGSRHNLIMPGDATHMGDGWETKRRRGPGHDWTIVRLGTAGAIRRVEVDTRHFKGKRAGRLQPGRRSRRTGARPRRVAVGRSPAAHRPPTAYQACLRGRPAAAWRHYIRAVQHLSRRRRRAPAPVWPATVGNRRARRDRSERTSFLCDLCALCGYVLVTCASRRSTPSTRNPQPARSSDAAGRHAGPRRWHVRGRFRAPRR